MQPACHTPHAVPPHLSLQWVGVFAIVGIQARGVEGVEWG